MCCDSDCCQRSLTVNILGEIYRLCPWIIMIRQASCYRSYLYICDPGTVKNPSGCFFPGKSRCASYSLITGKSAFELCRCRERQKHSDDQKKIRPVKSVVSISITISVHIITPYGLSAWFPQLPDIREGKHLFPYASFPQAVLREGREHLLHRLRGFLFYPPL